MSDPFQKWCKIFTSVAAFLVIAPSSPAIAGDAVHWAFAPVVAVPPPVVPAVQSSIDAFIRAELQTRGIESAPAAAPRELFRRLSFDLTGVPPSFEQVQAFASAVESDPERFGEVVAAAVDQMLASSSFGEKWARHWLDVARYADTKGYVFEEERRYPFSYSYRDWVIKAFNTDMPYDEFLVAQLAADLVKDAPPSDLAAMGYLTLGRRFLNREPDIIDDRIDVVTRGMLGLTVACARCHDHKFDPVPIKDYYSLYGVFQSSMEPGELPLVGKPEDSAAYEQYQARLAELEAAIADYKNERRDELLTVESVKDYLQAAWESRDLDGRDLARFAQDRKLYPAALERWQSLVIKGDAAPGSTVALWRALAALPAESDASVISQTIASVTGGQGTLWDYFVMDAISSGAEVHAGIAALLTGGDGDPILTSDQGIAGLDPNALVRDYSVPNRNEVRKRQRAADKFRATDEGAPTRAMVMIDKPQPVEPVVFERGNPDRRGEQVPRQFLSILSGTDRKPFTQGSGRLELARAIADPDNPLTARVMANRIWMHLMGTPLVESPSDFGVRTPEPQIPGLLDHLAADFVANGWSMKHLIRSIVLSQTYQQSTIADPAVKEADPDNRLYARATRKRLTFEGLRDSMLTVTGKLDPKMFGRAVDIESGGSRKTIYGFVDRQNLPGLFRTFDFAGPDAHCPKRHETTVPQQALFLMNNAFTQEAAAALSKVVATGDGDEGRITAIYRAALARNPSAEEIAMGREFINACEADGENGEDGWKAFAQAVLASNEFAFCD
ncbi:MAG: DUF1553 domain-containing protein [Verrucomicrobiae bacterium]|nr:DUF1553 domain-containing protein [Verrucomicrobiae bacterium]